SYPEPAPASGPREFREAGCASFVTHLAVVWLGLGLRRRSRRARRTLGRRSRRRRGLGRVARLLPLEALEPLLLLVDPGARLGDVVHRRVVLGQSRGRHLL